MGVREDISVTSIQRQARNKQYSLRAISNPYRFDRMTKKPTYIAEEAARLKQIYQERKKQDPSLSQDKVAEDCGWSSQSVVSQYMTGKIPLNISALISLSRTLRFAPESVSPRLAETLAQANNVQIDTAPTNGRWHQNTTDMGSAGRLLPVIGYEEAVAFFEADDGTPRKEPEDWVEAGGPAGPRAFILRVEGRSMEPDFKAGDKVVIDPDMPWKSGDFVVAKRDIDKAVSLKQISLEGGESYLYATNPDWPERVVKVSDGWSVYGRARRKIVDL